MKTIDNVRVVTILNVFFALLSIGIIAIPPLLNGATIQHAAVALLVVLFWQIMQIGIARDLLRAPKSKTRHCSIFTIVRFDSIIVTCPTVFVSKGSAGDQESNVL